jgi:hypothetical protein
MNWTWWLLAAFAALVFWCAWRRMKEISARQRSDIDGMMRTQNKADIEHGRRPTYPGVVDLPKENPRRPF